LLGVRGYNYVPTRTRHTGAGNQRFCGICIPESAAAAGAKAGTKTADASVIAGTVRQADGLEIRVWNRNADATTQDLPVLVEELKCAPTSALVVRRSAARCHVHL
jgi:hypothetical protein